MTKPLRFHWSLSQAGDPFRRAQSTLKQRGLLSLEAQLALCRRAEACGIESMLMAIGFSRPDPMLLSVALGLETEHIKFMVACRAGLLSPTTFVQQVNTVSALLQGRICLNMVCGHTPHELRYYGDFLPHDARYERTDEFLSICRAYWGREAEVNFHGSYYHIVQGRIHTPFVSPERTAPEIYLGGNSTQAAALAARHAACLWHLAEAPEALRPHIPAMVQTGTEMGLLVSLLARPTREEAVRDAYALIRRFGAETREVHREFASRSDSVGFTSTYRLAAGTTTDWATPYLWTGAVPYLGAPAIALVGGAKDIATAIMDYKQIGITQFLFMGWPDIDEMTFFGQEILPLIRRMEQEATSTPQRAAVAYTMAS